MHTIFLRAVIIGLSIILTQECFSQDVMNDYGWYDKTHEKHYYQITTKEQLNGLSYLASNGETFEGDTISIENDIVTDSYATADAFAGTLLGNNHTISGLSVPLIGTLEGKIDGLTIDGSYFRADGDIGAFAVTSAGGVIINCTNMSDITVVANQYSPNVGGICGTLTDKGRIVNCNNHGAISVTITNDKTATYVLRGGGIAGKAAGGSRITACTNHARIYGTSDSNVLIGGIVGDLQSSDIEGCDNNGEVSSYISRSVQSGVLQNTGGVIGRAQNSSIDRCVNSGSVGNNTDLVAGICGYSGYCDIFNCINYGDVRSSEYYYFSCANGITSYFMGRNTMSKFMNCINMGSISSASKGYTATAGGICYEINNAIVANCTNMGSVSASAPGGHKFTISSYELENCTELNTTPGIDDANVFVGENNKDAANRPLCLWEDADGTVGFHNPFVVYIEALQGLAAVNVFSSVPNGEYVFECSDGTGIVARLETDKRAALISGLKQNTDYSYVVYPTDENDNKMYGTFTTEPIELVTSVIDCGYTTVRVRCVARAQGVSVDECGVLYKEQSAGEWIKITTENGAETTIDGLKDNTYYILKPYVMVGGEPVEGEALQVQTKELVPVFENTETGLWSLSFQCGNVEALDGYEYGVLLTDNGRIFCPDENGRIVIDSLTYRATYSLKSFIIKGGMTYYYEMGNFTTKSSGTCEPLFVSPRAAMVHGVMYSYIPNYKGSFEYRDIYASESVPSSFVNAVVTDGKADSWATIVFPESGLYQYRMKTTYGTPGYSSYKEYFGEWMVVDTDKNNCSIVAPYFLNMSADKQGNRLTLGCLCVEGEETITESGIEYRMEGSDRYNTIKLSSDYPEDGKMSYGFSTLVDGYKYNCRFYVRCNEKIYYSNVVVFDSEGNYDIVSGIGQVVQDNKEIDYTQPVDLTVFSIDGQVVTIGSNTTYSLRDIFSSLKRGVYIVRLEQDGRKEQRKIIVE